MKVTLFEKSGNLCYSTSHKVPASKYEDLLISMGWRFVGALQAEIYAVIIFQL